MLKQLRTQSRTYEDIQWTLTITKDKYNQKVKGYDGYYEFWLNNKDYGMMTYVFGMQLKNWKEAEEYINQATSEEYKQGYYEDIKKLEADYISQHSNSCPFVDTIIHHLLKGVNNGNKKKDEETQGQKSLHTDSKQCKEN